MECAHFLGCLIEEGVICQGFFAGDPDKEPKLKKCEVERTASCMKKLGYRPTEVTRKDDCCTTYEFEPSWQARYAALTEEPQLALLYQTRIPKKHRFPEAELLKLVFPEIGKAKDEFARHDLEEKGKKDLPGLLASARKQKTVELRYETFLPEYDFKKKGFPTGLSDIMSASLGKKGAFKLKFSNLAKATLVPVPVNDARQTANWKKGPKATDVFVKATIQRVRYEILRPSRVETRELVMRIDEVALVVHQSHFSFGKTWLYELGRLKVK